jgi:hypothetical protein
MDLIQAEFKRLSALQVIVVCEYYVDNRGREYHLARIANQKDRLDNLPQNFYRVKVKRGRF